MRGDLTRKVRFGDRDTHNRGKGHVAKEAEIGVMQLQAKD